MTRDKKRKRIRKGSLKKIDEKMQIDRNPELRTIKNAEIHCKKVIKKIESFSVQDFIADNWDRCMKEAEDEMPWNNK